eukprot:16434158-Heterocapsa_arctica.AAC.1
MRPWSFLDASMTPRNISGFAAPPNNFTNKAKELAHEIIQVRVWVGGRGLRCTRMFTDAVSWGFKEAGHLGQVLGRSFGSKESGGSARVSF